jgi:hypothetical protein
MSKSRDFSKPPGGRRMRIALHLYDPTTRQYRHVIGSGALVTVRNVVEQRRLWRAVENAIARGEWRQDGPPDLGDPDAAGAGAGGVAVPS